MAGRGGARVGSGRKPRATVADFPVIDGGLAGEVSVHAPADLPEESKPYWERYAPLAIERRTLTKATEPTFRLLCELESERAAVKATIDKDGRTYIKCTVDGAGNEHQELKAHPLKGDYAKLAKDTVALLARFSLAPFGKPAGGAGKSKPEQANDARRNKFFGTAARA